MPVYRVPVNLTWDDPGSPGVNVWHVRTTTIAPQSEALNGAMASLSDFYANLTQQGADNPFRAGLQIDVEAVTDVETSEQREVSFQDVVSGGTAADAPMVCQIVVGWRTTVIGRRARGRTFLGPLSQQALGTDGTPKDSCLAKVQAAADAFVTRSLVDNNWAFGVYGLATAGGGPTAPRVLRDFTRATVRDTFAVLRSRRD